MLAIKIAATICLSSFAGLLGAALPTASTTDTSTKTPTRTNHLTAVTHSVVAGRGGLKFDPDNVVAEVGDVIEWHFLRVNHSVVQSSFSKPCEPLVDDVSHEQTGFFAGFNFAVSEGQSDKVFQFVVEDDSPVWFYCPQLVGEHCRSGMVGVINQNFDDPEFGLDAHRQRAALVDEIVIPELEQGGAVLANPNPLDGF